MEKTHEQFDYALSQSQAETFFFSTKLNLVVLFHILKFTILFFMDSNPAG